MDKSMVTPAKKILYVVFLLTFLLLDCTAGLGSSAIGGVHASSSLRPLPAVPPEVGTSNILVADTASDGLPSEQMDEDVVCVAITGGAGQIAYALLPLIMQGRVFGEGRRVHLRLLDIDPCAGVLEGVAMEIRDCCCDLVTEVVVTTDPKIAFQGADAVVLLGGFPRLPGMERRDLIAKNVPIMAEHGKEIAECASKSVRVLVVANPACTNCLVASACAPSIPKSQFSSLSRLDHDRLSAMLAEEISADLHDGVAAVSPVQDVGHPDVPHESTRADSNGRRQPSFAGKTTGFLEIRNVCLWGNHSPTMWPDVSMAEARIPGGSWVPVEYLLGLGKCPETARTDESIGERFQDNAHAVRAAGRERFITEIIPQVRDRGTKVIEARGKSSALSAANAIANHFRDWLTVSPAKRVVPREAGQDETAFAGHGSCILSMGAYSNGNPYGVADGLFFSFPVDCGEGRHRILDGFSPDTDMLQRSEQELLEERQEAFDVLKELGLFQSQ